MTHSSPTLGLVRLNRKNRPSLSHPQLSMMFRKEIDLIRPIGEPYVHLKVKFFDTQFTNSWTGKAEQEEQTFSISSTVFLCYPIRLHVTLATALQYGESLHRTIMVYLFACWVILYAFLSSADFFQNQLFQKKISGIQSECQTVWIQIRPNILSGLIWHQAICKGYQQMTIVGRVKWTEVFTYRS